MPQDGNGVARVFNLMLARQIGERQVHLPVHVFIENAVRLVAVHTHHPVSALINQTGLDGFQHRPDRAHGLRPLPRHNYRHAFFDDARLFRRDLGQGCTQKRFMIHADRRDGGGQRRGDHICGVQSATKAHFQKAGVSGVAGKRQKRCGGGDLKKRDGIVAVGFFAFFQQGGQLVVINQLTRHTNAFSEIYQMGGRIHMHAVTRRLQYGAGVGGC